MDDAPTQPDANGTPAWSVVIPAYNRPQRLQQCLDALARLDAPEGGFEVLVTDDGSSPPLAEAVAIPQGLDARIIRQDNAGPAAARNRGASEARGRWLAFTDDDCRPRPGWLVMLEQGISDDQSVVGGHTINALPDCTPASASQLLIDYLHDYFNAGGGGPRFFPSNNFCISKRAYEALGGFDEGFPLAAAEDRDFCDRAIEAGLNLRYQPGAVIDHAHGMTLRGFWKQHFNYGRGAYAYRRRRGQRRRDPVKIEPLRFYMGLIAYPLRKAGAPRAAKLSLLMLVSQVANTAGYFRERRSGKQTKQG